MNPRFPLLSTIALVLTWLGWILFGLGAIELLLVIIALFMRINVPTVVAITSIVLVPSGALLVALGECIRVIFAIEQNTYDASKALAEMCSAMRADLQRDKAKLPPVV